MGLFSRKKATTATLRRMWHSPPPGAPWYYWTYVLFEARGDAIQVKLSKRQAKKFAKACCEGESGHLVYSGKSLISWERASADKPLRSKSGVVAFLSYAHEWSEDAEYIAQVLVSRGITVWLDRKKLSPGDQLGKKVREAIVKANFFVALLSPEYFASPWCIRELEGAAEDGARIIPIKVSEGGLVFPPHIKSLYEEELGEPVFLDLRRRDPSVKLAELAEEMLAEYKADA